MHEIHRSTAFEIYNSARKVLVADPERLNSLEKYLAQAVVELCHGFIDAAESDYNAASTLYPFWENYPPEERGRQPRGDQFPWIEVGEHTIGTKLARAVASRFEVDDIGFPTGADQRFVVSGEGIEKATDGLTNAAWLCVDIKSVGPRDDAAHAVMSHNQISGSGEWESKAEGVLNALMMATGRSASHAFHAALPPLIVLPDGRVAPTITMALKPVYAMKPSNAGKWSGQPLHRLHLITIPNGLLLTQNPNYLAKYPGLLFPGKDDKAKDPRKLRARVSFEKLEQIAAWRHQEIWAAEG